MARHLKHIVFGLVLLLAVGQVFGAGADETEDWFARGTIHIRQRQWDEAIAAYARAVELLPHDFEAYNNRAVAYFYKQAYDQAIKYFSAALRINPSFPEALTNRGITWFHKQIYAAAIVDTTAALELNPYLHEAYWGRAAARTKRREYELALVDYTRLLMVEQDGARAGVNSSGEDEVIDRHTDALVLKIVNKEVRKKGLTAHIAHHCCPVNL